MFSRPVVTLENISKCFQLYDQPRHRLLQMLYRGRRQYFKEFWALRNISININRGDCLGIVGFNGAGKSTLLQLICGTLTQTDGIISVRGRIAALLELGAGFNPEFTGRENIYFSALVLGLSEAEITARYDEIVAFAELGSFIDQPVKSYSSGMYVRLAFSVATCVDPDILIIDEALSVGDHYFQKKCIERILFFKQQKKTILFCSHAMFLVNQLCDRAIWLECGEIREDGPATHVTAAYENCGRKRESLTTKEEKLSTSGMVEISSPPVTVASIRLNNSDKQIRLRQGEGLEVEINCTSSDSELEYSLAVGIRRNDDLICHVVNMAREEGTPLCGDQRVMLYYPALPFLSGDFSVVVSALDRSGLQCFYQKESPRFIVLPLDKWDQEIGLLRLEHEWCR